MRLTAGKLPRRLRPSCLLETRRPSCKLLSSSLAVICAVGSLLQFAGCCFLGSSLRRLAPEGLVGGADGQKASLLARHAAVGSKLPAGTHRPKQSLGQSYLTDPNTIEKIVASFNKGVEERLADTSGAVVEVGPGLGAITRLLHGKYPDMTAVEIDDRAVQILQTELPSLNIVHTDVRDFDYDVLRQRYGQRVNFIGNLPYSIVSEIVSAMCQKPECIRYGQVMVQKEVAQKIIAQPGSAAYGILAVLCQIYTKPRKVFNVPPTVFYPRPKVTSSIVEFDFRDPEDFAGVNKEALHELVSTAFQQRKKVLRQSLKQLLERKGTWLPALWEKKRAEQVSPDEYLKLFRTLKL
eukprot:TRINITY_DN11102_c0_g1_i1.p1 TRINITY_DN11102_c0_g1~~TRINITY_DN11102_c0_g1_i1.p1  ORF type:complete len:351 (+),score=76.59 TRINITY_DN11102_c0_g1_i1:77-1129(+)